MSKYDVNDRKQRRKPKIGNCIAAAVGRSVKDLRRSKHGPTSLHRRKSKTTWKVEDPTRTMPRSNKDISISSYAMIPRLEG